MRFTVYQDSLPGGRPNNEDRVAYCYSREAVLLVVADGMGGHLHGEVAAQIAVQTLTDKFQSDARPRLADPFGFLHQSIQQAHFAILDYASQHDLAETPRTTCVACLIQDNIAYWAHAGDSRLYLLRQGRVAARTRDHSRVRLLIDEGIISERQAATHPDRNRIYSCLGDTQPPEIEFSRKTPLEQGDVLLLCTDGLWGMLPPETLARSLHLADLTQTMPRLLKEAETQGGARGDNVSAVAVRWDEQYAFDHQPSVSTQAMGLDEIATHMDEFGRRPAAQATRTDLSEDEIERAIAEIRAAIEKYTPKP